jgi:hypothetical protein
MKNGLPEDLDELQKMLNGAYRKGNQDAHAGCKIIKDLLQKEFDEFRKKYGPLDGGGCMADAFC